MTTSSIIATLQFSIHTIYSPSRSTKTVGFDCCKKRQLAAEVLVSTTDSYQEGADGSRAWHVELSGREKQILQLVAAGWIDKNVAAELNISVNTLRTYWGRIRKKSGRLTRAAIIAAFVRWESNPAESDLHSAISTSLLDVISDPDLVRWSATYYAIAFQNLQDVMRKVCCLTRVIAAYPHDGIGSMSETDLTNCVCKTLVEEGGYLMAWIGFARDDDAKSIYCAASAGDATGYLNQARISWSDNRYGSGPTGRAVRIGQAQINQDFHTNPQVAPWQELALKHGFQSSMAVPVKCGSETIGALSVYASAPNSFQEPEMRLLELVAADLAIRLIQLRSMT